MEVLQQEIPQPDNNNITSPFNTNDKVKSYHARIVDETGDNEISGNDSNLDVEVVNLQSDLAELILNDD